MVRKIGILCLLSVCLVAGSAHAQLKRVYQLSGLIVNRATHEAVPYVQVRINNSRRGTVANGDGFYSIPVVENDTIYFSSLGFLTTQFVFADYMKEYQGDANSAYVYAINYLEEDSILISGITIFPYNTPGKLRTAIIETEVPEDVESANARHNLSPKTMDVLIGGLKVDEGERIMVARQLYYNQQMHKHVAPTMPLFDPIAVYQLLRYINDKTKARKEKDLNYWND
ncbi:MAG: carboxypeptidase-like regulatory domain-containing protein [Bacteroidetes bacterium]|nr:carboxypeptidase-like regulatory domain-containing protein [Bacteroidota bacterium]MBL0016893.1 carboxypeptidase-like regulatory domain-containing protein [Bacteroidota bacterium]